MTRDRRTVDPEVLEKVRQVMTEHFAAQTFHNVGIRDICKAARVSPKTLYKYFGSKEDLLLACVERDLAELTEITRQAVGEYPEDPMAQLLAVGRTFFNFYITRQDVARIVFLNVPAIYWVNQASQAQTDFMGLIHSALVQGQRDGTMTSELDPVVLTNVLAGAANRLLAAWLISGTGSEEMLAHFEATYRSFFEGSLRN